MTTRVDIAVVGGGAAGIAAAISAARAGCTTLLLDQRPAAGGTGGFSGLTTLCGLFDDEGKFLNEGFACEFAAAIGESPALPMGRVWVLPYRPEKFRAVAARLLTATPNLQARWSAPLTDVVVEGEGQAESFQNSSSSRRDEAQTSQLAETVRGKNQSLLTSAATSQRIVRLNGIAVGAVIDCSGSAEVARLIGAECLATDATSQAPAVIFPLQNVTHELNSPAAVARVLLPLARAGFPPLNFQTSLETNTVTVKFTGRTDQVLDVIAFLKAKVRGFENCSTPLTEFTPAHRAGRMIIGQYLLTGADVLAGRKSSDAVARGAWPIEQWSADGVARFKYLPPGAHYDIPARALRAAQVENLFMAGKTISADVDAIASARVMGCCLATGASAGNLAAAWLESERTT